MSDPLKAYVQEAERQRHQPPRTRSKKTAPAPVLADPPSAETLARAAANALADDGCIQHQTEDPAGRLPVASTHTYAVNSADRKSQ